MAAPVVLAPSAVSIAAITSTLLLLVAVMLVLYGLLYGYNYTLGALLNMLADVLDFKVWRVRINLSGQVEALNDTIRQAIGRGIDTVEKDVARTWDALAWVIRETGDVMLALAEDVYGALDGLTRGEIPRQVGAVAKPIARELGAFRNAIRQYVNQELARFANGIDGLARDLTAEALARQRGIDWLGDRLGSLVMPRIRSLDARVDDVVGYTRRNLRVRIGRLEAMLAAGTLGAIAIAAVTRVFPYWQCTNVRRFNKGLCRLPVGMLDDLLLLVWPVLVLGNLCELAGIARRAASAALPAMRSLLVVADGAVDCSSIGPAPELPLRLTSLPSSSGSIAV